MKILHINWQIWGEFKGGHVVHVENLVKGIDKIHDINQAYLFTYEKKDQDDCHLISYQLEDLRIYEIKNCPIQSFYDFPSNDLQNSRLETIVRTVLEDFRPDVVHVHHLIQFPLSILDLIRYTLNIPVVVTIRDYWYVCKACTLRNIGNSICRINNNCYTCKECIGSKLLLADHVASQKTLHGEFLIRKYRYIRALSQCESITFVSDFLRSEYETLGISGDKAVVRTTGVPFNQNCDSKKFNRIRNVAFLGFFSRYKGGHFVLESLKEWKGSPFNLHLWGGIEDPSFIEEIKDDLSGVGVHVEGTYDRMDLKHILSNIDIGLVPSLWSDTAPQVVLDFLSFKIPVIASRIGGIPGFISDGVNGLLFEPGDKASFLKALERLVDENGYLEELSANIVHPKTTEEYVNEVTCLYKVCLDRVRATWADQSGRVVLNLQSTAGVCDIVGLAIKLKEAFTQYPSGTIFDVVARHQEFSGEAATLIAKLIAHCLQDAGCIDICEVPTSEENKAKCLTVRGRKRVRIAVFALGDHQVASSRVRAYNVLSRLELFGYQVDFKEELEYCDEYDVIVVQKRWDDFFLSVKKPIILDIDDNYFEHGPDSQQLVKLSQMAAAIVVSTQNLCAIARRYNSNVCIIPTGLDVHEIVQNPARLPNPDGKRRAVWVGYPENVRYLKKVLPLLREAKYTLRIITRKTPELEELIDSNTAFVEFFEWSLSSVDHLIAECDIGIAPLENDSWSSAKSGYKVLKYLSLGLRVICDPSAEYKSIEEQIGEKIVASTHDDWASLLATDRAFNTLQIMTFLERYQSETVSKWVEVVKVVQRDRVPGRQLNEVRNLLYNRTALLQDCRRELNKKDNLVQEMSCQLADLKYKLEELEQQLAQRNDQLGKCVRQISENEQRLAEQMLSINDYQQRLADQASHIGKADQALLACNHQIQELLNSKSWQITAPLRKIYSLISNKP